MKKYFQLLPVLVLSLAIFQSTSVSAKAKQKRMIASNAFDCDCDNAENSCNEFEHLVLNNFIDLNTSNFYLNGIVQLFYSLICQKIQSIFNFSF